jgi:hypothetical protein
MTSSSSSTFRHGRHEARPDALDAVRPRRAARQDRGGLRLAGDDLQLGVAVLEELPGARDGPARPDAAHEVVDLPVELLPQLGARRAPVGLGVGRVGELVGQEDVVALGHRPRRVDRLVHAPERLDDLDRGAVEAQQALALAAHALRQREDQVVALGGADEGQRDPGVARGGLDDGRAARLDAALRSAASIMATPMRSLTEPPGLYASSLPKSSTPSGAMRLRRTIGVRPPTRRR